ncbi:MAG: GHKL domain-containing protein [Clostridiales bacterium]|nr:GHKL domain-containing protein [Clostridiales bacterium]
MRYTLKRKLNLRKVALFSVVINCFQIAAIVMVLLYILTNGSEVNRYIEISILLLALLIVAWGAVLDIREAFNAQKTSEQARMLEEAYSQLEDLNGTLRRQRHDFMNHLQVVFSLMEMGEYPDAMQYVENVYGDIQRTGSVLKTSIPAVNALIAAKRDDCEEHGIRFTTEIASAWQDLPVAGWEMCRVMGNLIDNARDALMSVKDHPSPAIAVSIEETPAAFNFSVSNNGPAIPREIMDSIFEMGFTTKEEGHGSGLSIVVEIMESYRGTVSVKSNDSLTTFYGTIPKGNHA